MESPRNLGFIPDDRVGLISDPSAKTLRICLKGAFGAPVWVRGLSQSTEFLIDLAELSPNDTKSIKSLIACDDDLIPLQRLLTVGEILIGGKKYAFVTVKE